MATTQPQVVDDDDRSGQAHWRETPHPPAALLPRWLVGEFFGTFLLVFFGCGSVCAAVLTGAQTGIFQVAIVWGLGITTAIYLTGSLSGAHLNPSVTLAMAVWGEFPARRVVPYIAVQLGAAFISAAVLYVIYAGALHVFEQKNGLVRGTPGSELSAKVFGEYFPPPSARVPANAPPSARLPESSIDALVTPASAFAIEVIGTAVLLLVIFCCTDERNLNRPQILTAATIGLTVTLLISLLGPLTMACFNPARDLGPRLFSAAAGWGSVPFTANGSGWWTVYILAPILGGQVGGAIYRFCFKASYASV
jgi:glycerol uptake facilitator protein